MGHQAAVQLGQQVVGQPIGHVRRLSPLQRRPTMALGFVRRRVQAAAPGAIFLPQKAEPFQGSFLAHGTPAEQAPAPGPAIPPVAGEDLIPAFARKDHLDTS